MNEDNQNRPDELHMKTLQALKPFTATQIVIELKEDILDAVATFTDIKIANYEQPHPHGIQQWTTVSAVVTLSGSFAGKLLNGIRVRGWISEQDYAMAKMTDDEIKRAIANCAAWNIISEKHQYILG